MLRITCTYHCHGITVQDRIDGEDGVVGHVGQDVDHRHYGHGDGDGQRQIPVVPANKQQREAEEVRYRLPPD